MATVKLTNIKKSSGRGHHQGRVAGDRGPRFCVFVGPSGCASPPC